MRKSKLPKLQSSRLWSKKLRNTFPLHRQTPEFLRLLLHPELVKTQQLPHRHPLEV